MSAVAKVILLVQFFANTSLSVMAIASLIEHFFGSFSCTDDPSSKTRIMLIVDAATFRTWSCGDLDTAVIREMLSSAILVRMVAATDFTWVAEHAGTKLSGIESDIIDKLMSHFRA